MGRFNVIKDLAETFVLLTGIQLQAWMAPVFFLVVGILLFPVIRRSHRVGKARKRLRLIPYRRLAERRRLEDEALALVAGHPGGQLELAQEAARLGRPDLARRALATLEASGKRQRQRLELARKLDPPPATRPWRREPPSSGWWVKACWRRPAAGSSWPSGAGQP